jgi:DNA mismatch repair protein MutH
MRAALSATRKTRALARSRHLPPRRRSAAALRPEPESTVELMARAHDLAGHNLAELAVRAGIPLPSEPRRAKGYVGALVEALLGARAGSASVPDFPALGIELKTIPIAPNGTPLESTFVCTVGLCDIADSEWEQSGVYRKLARVLWVPIEGDRTRAFEQRRIGAPRLWSPDATQHAALRADFEELAAVIARGDVELLTARVGRCLQVRPKAANSRVRGRGVDGDGAPLRTLPRGFYLRASFTASIFAAAALEAF